MYSKQLTKIAKVAHEEDVEEETGVEVKFPLDVRS